MSVGEKAIVPPRIICLVGLVVGGIITACFHSFAGFTLLSSVILAVMIIGSVLYFRAVEDDPHRFEESFGFYLVGMFLLVCVVVGIES